MREEDDPKFRPRTNTLTDKQNESKSTTSKLTDRFSSKGRGSNVRASGQSSRGSVTYGLNNGEQDVDYEGFLSNSTALWTVIDQQRLVALNGLHHRMLEYHNNIHVKETTLSPSTMAEVEENKELMVVQSVLFSNDRLDKPYSVTFGELSQFCQRSKEDLAASKDSVLWIHIRDLIALEPIAKCFDIHELLSAGFQDLRAHSTFLPAFGEVLLTIVTCMRENNDFNMYKMFIYISEQVIVTFQAELLPDIMDPELSSPDKLINPLFENYIHLRTQCLRYGTIFLLYEIAMLSLKALDSSMEFISYSLSYFNKVVHLRLLHRERLAVLVKMHMVSSGIRFFKGVIHECNQNIQLFLDTAIDCSAAEPKGLGRILHTELLHEHHIPYLMDLSDSFSFVLSSLAHQMDESLRLETELEATMQLRATNTTIVLSLIATIFLPLTFLAGVFGMNFQVDGGYSIPLLNHGYGPLAFYLMCAVSAVVSFAFFIMQGWLEFGIFGRLFKGLWWSPHIDDNEGRKETELEDVEALKRAQEEETRRQEEADVRRSFQSATRNVERVLNLRASNLAGNASMVGRPTLSPLMTAGGVKPIQQAPQHHPGHHGHHGHHHHQQHHSTNVPSSAALSFASTTSTATDNTQSSQPVQPVKRRRHSAYIIAAHHAQKQQLQQYMQQQQQQQQQGKSYSVGGGPAPQRQQRTAAQQQLAGGDEPDESRSSVGDDEDDRDWTRSKDGGFAMSILSTGDSSSGRGDNGAAADGVGRESVSVALDLSRDSFRRTAGGTVDLI